MDNPLFTNDTDGSLPSQPGKPQGANAAAELIRHKLDAIYKDEPAAKKELAEIQAADKPLSKHQKFMKQLGSSGKPLPEIQTAWHNYYVGLSDKEKHEVWQEFYDASKQNAPARPLSPIETAAAALAPKVIISEHQPPTASAPPKSDHRTVADLKQQVLRKVNRSRSSQLKARHHLQSLAFGLGLGALAVFIVLFSFFNQLFIAPLIQPSRHVSATPIIVTANSVAPTSTPEVIIPKINVEIPVDYTQTSTDENVIENALENGVVHYPNTVMPGQQGNAAFFGHSSNNIFNPGKYKFAFVLLHQLVVGDTFYLTYNSKVYTYQVISRQIVPPSDVGVLTDTQGKSATATLITCDPPGTSINRLVVTGEQISPDPGGDSAPAAKTQVATAPTVLASNGPSLFSRLWHAVF